MLGATKAGSTGDQFFNWLGSGIKGLTNTDFSKYFNSNSYPTTPVDSGMAP
jgi:hypothetical protein